MISYDTHGTDGDVEGGGPSPTFDDHEVDDLRIETVAAVLGHGSTTADQDSNRAKFRMALQTMKPASEHDGLEIEP